MQPPQDSFQPSVPYGQEQSAQWTQMPFSGQQAYGVPQQGYAQPGQVPPPAQLQPEVTYPQGMPVYAQPQQAAPAPQPVPPQSPYPPQGPYPPQTGKVPQVAYQPPKTGMPAQKKKTSRTGYIVLIAVVVVFLVLVLLRLVSPGQASFALVQAGALSARYAGDAVIVRNETVYVQEGVSQVDYIAPEGGLMEREKQVALVYSSGFSAKEWTTLDNYRLQIKREQKELMQDAASDSKLLNLMGRVTERAMEVQRMVQGTPGSLTRQEQLLQDVIAERQDYMHEKYSEEQKLNRLWDEEKAQLNRIAVWTKPYLTNTTGLVSFYTDGFETALNTNTYTRYSPAEVRRIYQGQVPQTELTLSKKSVPVYRLVRQEPWVVLMLCSDMEWTPVEGRTYQLLIESFDNTIVDAKVESFTRSGGELLVRLLIYDTTKLPSVMYIRSCKVQLGESVNTLAVPSRAIYEQNGRKGVVLSTEGGEYWTGVEIISNDGQTAYIIPENPGVLYQGVRVRLFD